LRPASGIKREHDGAEVIATLPIGKDVSAIAEAGKFFPNIKSFGADDARPEGFPRRLAAIIFRRIVNRKGSIDCEISYQFLLKARVLSRSSCKYLAIDTGLLLTPCLQFDLRRRERLWLRQATRIVSGGEGLVEPTGVITTSQIHSSYLACARISEFEHPVL
jgi:hypothetical protein